MEYGVARTTSIELSYAVCCNLRGLKRRDAEGNVVPAAPGAEAAAAEAQNAEAARELLRYLNFAHLLLLIEAQKAEKARRGGEKSRRELRPRVGGAPPPGVCLPASLNPSPPPD